jgi:hypothetical protein
VLILHIIAIDGWLKIIIRKNRPKGGKDERLTGIIYKEEIILNDDMTTHHLDNDKSG